MAITRVGIGTTPEQRQKSYTIATNKYFNTDAYDYARKIGTGDFFLTLLQRIGPNTDLSSVNSLLKNQKGSEKYSA